MQVSVGTLLAFTMVAISVLILRYVPPDEVPLPSSLQAAINSVSLRYSCIAEDVEVDSTKISDGISSGDVTPLLVKALAPAPIKYPLISRAEKGTCVMQ